MHLPELAGGLGAAVLADELSLGQTSVDHHGLWAAMGSNNMLLYLAGLSGVPQSFMKLLILMAPRTESFLACDLATIAPVTFFIFVMSVINGLKVALKWPTR